VRPVETKVVYLGQIVAINNWIVFHSSLLKRMFFFETT